MELSPPTFLYLSSHPEISQIQKDIGAAGKERIPPLKYNVAGKGTKLGGRLLLPMNQEGDPTPPIRRMDSLRQKFRRLSSGSSKINNDETQPIPQTTTQQKQSATVDISDLLDEVDQGGSAILLRRPDHISITGRSILSAFQYTINTNGAITINSTSALGVMNSSALKEDSKHLKTFFDVNDTLEYACGLDCRKGSTVALQLGSMVDNETDNSTAKDITPELHRKIEESITNSDKEELDKTVCISTTKDLKDPIRLCQAIVLLSKEETLPDDYDIGITFTERKDRIVIECISPGGWFNSKGCAIREGDIIVGINEYILSGMSPEDVSGIIKDIISSPESTQLSITAIATYLTRWDKIR